MGSLRALTSGPTRTDVGRGSGAPDLEVHRRRALRRARNPLRRLGVIIKRFMPLLLILGAGALLYFSATVLDAFLLAVSFVWHFAFGLLITIVPFGALFLSLSRSRVERILPGDRKVTTFDDYWGQGRLKALMRQWLGLLTDRAAFVRMGGRYINGLLLYGEPGTGKTMLARAMAGEAGAAFLSMDGSGFRTTFWGADTLKMRWFVRTARKLARRYGAAIACIDEIDAMGTSRSGGRALTRLLYEMDRMGTTRRWHVLFMGSTNRPDALDPALLMPGRFDQLIKVNLPDAAGRREIVQGYLSTIRHDASVDVEAIVADAAASTPAQIMAALTKDAVRIALFARHPAVTQKDIDQAFHEQWRGTENPIEEMAPDQRRQIAVHEAGRAVVQHVLLPGERIVRLTIVPRAPGHGVQPLDQAERYSHPLRRIVADIMVGMAGHVATRIVFGEEWTGASGDFQQARSHLRRLQSLGFFGPPVQEPSPESDARAEKVLADFWRDLEGKVEQILRGHCGKLVALADALLKRSSLSQGDVLSILEPRRAPVEEQERPGEALTFLPLTAPACTELELVGMS
jgi:cell division protease FtsH